MSPVLAALHVRPIEFEPARTRGCCGIGVDRDHFEIGTGPHLQHTVVRAHGDMFAATLGPRANARFDELLALFERRRGNDQMIERRANHQRPGAVSLASKSSSILAPFRS